MPERPFAPTPDPNPPARGRTFPADAGAGDAGPRGPGLATGLATDLPAAPGAVAPPPLTDASGAAADVGTPDPQASSGMVHEAVGILDSEEALVAAVDELAMAGFAQHELSLMAGDEVVRRKLGHVLHRVEDAKDHPEAPRQNYVAPEEVGNAQGAAIGIPAYVGAVIATGAVLASGGTALVAALAAAAGGGVGGGLGAVLARWVGQTRHNLLQQHMEKGGILLWVNLRDAERERLAREILARHSRHPVEVHDIPQAGSGTPAP